jgi:hypothetical protein
MDVTPVRDLDLVNRRGHSEDGQFKEIPTCEDDSVNPSVRYKQPRACLHVSEKGKKRQLTRICHIAKPANVDTVWSRQTAS